MNELPDKAVIEVLLQRASDFGESGRHPQAVAVLTEALSKHPQDVQALRHRGRYLIALQRPRAALDDVNACLRLCSEDKTLYGDRGVALSMLGLFEDAEKDLSRAIECRDSEEPRYHLWRGYTRGQLGRHSEALSDLQTAQELGYKDSVVAENRARIYLELELDDHAAEEFERAASQSADRSDYFKNLAETHARAGRVEDAIEAIDRSLELDPTDRAARRLRADLFDRQGRAVEAQAERDRADAIYDLLESSGGRIRKSREQQTHRLVREHFAPHLVDDLIIHSRAYPPRVRADLQRGIEGFISGDVELVQLTDVRTRHSHEDITLTDVMSEDRHDPAVTFPASFEDVDIGEDRPVSCPRRGLWLLREKETPFVILLTPPPRYGCEQHVRVQIAVPATEDGERLGNQFLNRLKRAIQRSTCYRGKILSLESRESYTGESVGIRVHRLRPTDRADVILPERTLAQLDRNVVDFVGQRKRLLEAGFSGKKGVLLYGPPGTGKTHTIHYLASHLPEHTTLIISAEQVGLLNEYMTLARLLTPALVVIEDADLIARDREHSGGAYQEMLLNKLLNEMDGLNPESEIIFVLTTNRPEALEEALTSRPGRIDQAIEFPKPDADCRRRLTRLYAGKLSISETVLEQVVSRTENVTASFIKELVRRACQVRLSGDDSNVLTVEDVDVALDELLHSGSSLNQALLGATDSESRPG